MRTSRCLQLLLISQPRRARAAGLLLRLPASQPEQATAGSAAAGRVGDQEAACELGPEATRGACGGLQGHAMDALCRLLEGGSAALKALSHHPYRPRGR